MSYPKTLSTYPTWMLEVAERFEAGCKQVSYKLPSARHAARMRQLFYGFRAALAAEGVQSPQFAAVRFSVQGKLLVLTHVDELFPAPKEVSDV